MTTKKPWEDPESIGENILPMHASFLNEKTISLNGTWDFRIALGTELIDKPFDTGTWQKIQVPGCWETQGYGKPYYFAAGFPAFFDVDENIPHIDESQVYVAQYQRTFSCPSFEKGSRVILCFGSVRSAFRCWLNGKYIGCGKESMLPDEFDITDDLIPGENTLSVEVHSFSDASYLEDQDMWFLSGIYRDVTLRVEPETAILDVHAVADSDGSLRLSSVTRGGDLLSAELYEGDRLLNAVSGKPESELSLVCPKDHLKLWSAETPDLYTLKVKLFTGDREADCRMLEVGFRRIEIDGERLLCNGMPIKLRGVNYHAFTPDGGYYVPREVYERDLITMKRHNINAIRTSHYPQDDCFYTLCDRLGIYVMDECNLESHGVREKNVPGDDPKWTRACIDRMERMVLRDRNHPCVIIWSLGNESDSGTNHHRMRAAALNLDVTRPIHYEGGADLQASDFVCIGYSSWQREQFFAEGKDVPDRLGVVSSEMDPNLLMSVNTIQAKTYMGHPIVATEYMHSMGNSGYDMEKHAEVFEHSGRWCGGFVWDFKDKALSHPEYRYAYGGDFGPGDQPGTMCCNGVCSPDGIPHEQFQALRAAFQPLEAVYQDGILHLTNRNSFLDLADFSFGFEVTRDGEMISQGRDTISCEPRKSVDYKVSLPELSNEPGKVCLSIFFTLKKDTFWAEAGYPIAWYQWTLQDIPVPEPNPLDIRWRKHDDDYQITVSGTTYTVSGTTGDLISITDREGHSLLDSPLRPNFWRARTDADLGFIGIVMKKDQDLDAWGKISLGEASLPVRMIVVQNTLTVVNDLPGNGTLTRIYQPEEGGLSLSLSFRGKDSMPRRIGLMTELPDKLNQMKWLGLGPQDTYDHRTFGALFGRYAKDVTEQDEHMRPQEHGLKMGTRDVRLADQDGHGLEVSSAGDFGCAAWPYTLSELQKARHVTDLPEKAAHTTLLLDAAQDGLGDAFVKLSDQDRLQAGKEYGFRLLVRAI